MHVGSLVVGAVVGAALAVGGVYGIPQLVDPGPPIFDKGSLEDAVQGILAKRGARIVRCSQSDGPFWVCRALTHPRTGKLYNVTVAPNERCFTAVEADTAMEVDSHLLSWMRGYRGTRASCKGISGPEETSAMPEAFAAAHDDVSDESATANCDPNYTGACLDPESPDYDCSGGSGDGPNYTGKVVVVGGDPYGLDRDGNGIACQ